MVQYVRVVSGPSKQTTDAVTSLMVLGGLGFGVVWLWEKISQWYLLEAPYNYISGFYFYTVVTPLKTFASVWNWLNYSGITQYPNLNLCIAIAGIIAYFFIFVILVGFVSGLLEKIGIKKELQGTIMTLPAIIAFLWFIGAFVFSWLFAV